MKKTYHFDYQEGPGFLKLEANSKTGAIKILRCLTHDPENWVLVQINESRDCHIKISVDNGGVRTQ